MSREFRDLQIKLLAGGSGRAATNMRDHQSRQYRNATISLLGGSALAGVTGHLSSLAGAGAAVIFSRRGNRFGRAASYLERRTQRRGGRYK